MLFITFSSCSTKTVVGAQLPHVFRPPRKTKFWNLIWWEAQILWTQALKLYLQRSIKNWGHNLIMYIQSFLGISHVGVFLIIFLLTLAESIKSHPHHTVKRILWSSQEISLPLLLKAKHRPEYVEFLNRTDWNCVDDIFCFHFALSVWRRRRKKKTKLKQ